MRKNGKVETNAEKFNRLYSLRLEKVVKAIKILGNCSGAGYEYDMKVVDTSIEYLHQKLETTKSQFVPSKEVTGETSKEISDIVSGKVSVEESTDETPTG